MKLRLFLYTAIFAVFILPLYSDDFRWNLVNALARGNYQDVEKLIQTNIDSLALTDKRMVMSFVLTYSRGDTALQAMNMLEGYGVIPNSYDLYTALNMNQSDDVINLILRHGVAVNGEILLLAVARQKFDIAKQFIEAGVDVNYSYPLSRSYSDGMTPLLYAVKLNNFDLTKLLLDRGANINARSREGDTALSLANANGNLQIYNFLLERGASQPLPLPDSALQSSSGGMASFLNNQAEVFQRGVYRLSGGNVNIRFTGSPNAGSVSYTINGSAGSGAYRIDGRDLTVTMEGRTFVYRIDSNTAFSGNGEVWIRAGD